MNRSHGALIGTENETKTHQFDKIHFLAIFGDNRCQYKTRTHISHVLLRSILLLLLSFHYTRSFVLLFVHPFVRILRMYVVVYTNTL